MNFCPKCGAEVRSDDYSSSAEGVVSYSNMNTAPERKSSAFLVLNILLVVFSFLALDLSFSAILISYYYSISIGLIVVYAAIPFVISSAIFSAIDYEKKPQKEIQFMAVINGVIYMYFFSDMGTWIFYPIFKTVSELYDLV